MPDRNRRPRRNQNRNQQNRRRRPRQDNLNKEQMAERYGYALAFFKSDDGLWELFQKATKNNWSRVKFQTELLDSKWYKTHSAPYRQGIARKTMDPQTFKSEVRQKKQQIEGLATRYSAILGNRTMMRMAEDAVLFAWTEEQVADRLAKYVTTAAGGHYFGSLAAVEEQIRSTAFRNGVNVGDKAMKNWMRQIVRGQSSMEEYENSVRTHAARTFKAFAQEINGGMDLMDVASPYMETAAAILEMEPNKVDLFDPAIRKALTRKNDKGQTDVMGLTEFEEHLRRDPRWRKTSNARDSIMEAAHGVARMMGLRANA